MRKRSIQIETDKLVNKKVSQGKRLRVRDRQWERRARARNNKRPKIMHKIKALEK